MPKNNSSINNSLFDLLKGKGYSPTMLSTAGKEIPTPDEAEVFQFNFVKDGEDYGKVTLTIDDSSNLIVYYSDDVADSEKGNGSTYDWDDFIDKIKDFKKSKKTSKLKEDDDDEEAKSEGGDLSWYGLLNQLKRFAQRYQLSFELRNTDNLKSDMAKRDYMKKQDQIAESRRRVAEMDNRTLSGDRKEQRANSPEAIAQRKKEHQAELKKVSPEMRKKLRLPNPDKEDMAEGQTGVSVKKWAEQVRQEHGADTKFWNDKVHDRVIARKDKEIIGSYDRKANNGTVFSPEQGVAEGLNEFAQGDFNGDNDNNDLQLYLNVAKKLNMKKYKPSTAHDLIAKKMSELVDAVDDEKVDWARHMARKAQGLPSMLDQQGVAEGTDDSTQVLSDIVANEDFDALYNLMSSDTEAGKIVQRMYNDVSGEEGLHPDDDFEKILSIVLDHLTQDYGQQDVAEGSADKTVRVVKRNGKPIGEIGIDPEASPGNGSYYVKLYDGSVDESGFDTAEEALAELKYLVKQNVSEGYSLKKTSVSKHMEPGDPEEYTQDVNIKDTDYEIINNKTGQVVGTASQTTNDFMGSGALKITMKNGATRWLDIWDSEKGNPQTAFNRFVKDPKTASKYKGQDMKGVTEMDKSQTPSGRDGHVSHSTYGSRDKGDSTGPERTAKPVTAKQATTNAMDILNKQLEKKDVAEEATQKLAKGAKVYHTLHGTGTVVDFSTGPGASHWVDVKFIKDGLKGKSTRVDRKQLKLAKVESVAEGDDRGDYNSTANQAWAASKKYYKSKSPKAHAEAARLHTLAATYALSAGQDESVIHYHQMAAHEHNQDVKKYTQQVNEGYYPMGKQGSYSDAVPTTKIIIQHSRRIEEGEQRYRNIAKIFVENSDGERFAVPTNKPGLARVYARHIAEGGTPYDERGRHITSLVEEYSKMSGFMRATRGKQFNESAQQLVTEAVNYYQSLRESLSKMTGHRGYSAYFESWTPALMEDGEEQETNLNELFVQETLDPRIESVMPILGKLQRKLGNIKQVDELAEWADNIIEGDGREAINPQGIPEAAGAETLAHNIRTDRSNLKAFDLEETTDVTDDNPKSQGGTRAELLRKYANTKRSTDAEAARRAGATQSELKAAADSTEEIHEGASIEDIQSDILYRVMRNHPDLVSKYGPEYVADKARYVASFHTDAEEIGGSDKTAMVNHLVDTLKREAENGLDENLDANQIRAGQLGPTEKVGPQGAVGKLVGAEESVNESEDELARILQMVKHKR
jgi:hypothetical protein